MKNNIFLVDMDSFFASIEEARNPEIKGLPMVVAGRHKKSVVSACNSEAKKFGIKSAMPIFQAEKLCKNLIVLNVDMEEYVRVSNKIESILKTFTTNLEKASIDEWYLDFSNKNDFFSRDEIELANSIRYKIKNKLNLNCSIGISYNKFLAKTASELAKPNNVFLLDESNFKQYLWPLDISKMYMIGNANKKIVDKLGIKTIGEFANYKDKKTLEKELGVIWEYLYNNVNGRDIDLVKINRKYKSIGTSCSLYNEISKDYNIISIINYFFDKLYKRLIDNHFLTNSIQITIGYKQKKEVKSKVLSYYTKDRNYIYTNVMKLFNELLNQSTIDFIGIQFSNLQYEYSFESKNLNLIFHKDTNLIDDINSVFGKEVLFYASKLKK